MSDACETMQEYNYSKFQLTRYIKSDYVTSTLGYVFAENVLRWLRKYVFVHESYFLFCLRKHIRHYGEYSNSIHEGTNNAIRSAAATVTKAHKIENSLGIICRNAGRTLAAKQRKNSSEYLSSYTHHTQLSCI